MRAPLLILAGVVATLLTVPAGAQEKINLLNKDKAEESAKKIKALQKERITALKDAAEQIAALFKSGRTTADEVYEARLMALRAELDAAEKGPERVALYKSMVDVLKEYETWAVAQHQAARATAATALKVKARRLESEIHLEQAKVQADKESK
ncbi:hypothetical protein J8F10_13140 [Gemmata sp. G18]|uniref:Uncharacterized protein n=1 Tax=Gemmata palustris TaxID=2822762 RepID=A0ABS5BRB9_9BACT|nr:hypothetical protein [Gemmata palustris]MBP3956228.1 hypothetical protein [Gemmata palustris]